jgi:hypothetical protein
MNKNDTKTLDIECFKLNLKKGFDKDDKIDLSSIELIFVEKYLDAIKPLLGYFSSSSELSGVIKIARQGVLLRPQFSGHRKKYESVAIGLAISILSQDITRGTLKGKPLNLDELKKTYGYDDVVFEAPQEDLLNNTSWFLELSQVYPFSIIRIFKVLYNPWEAFLKTFLRQVYKDYQKALDETLHHLKVPPKPTLKKEALKKENIYIITYRCQRSFVSAVLTPATLNEIFVTGIDKLIISNTLAYAITPDESVAFYYAGVLNYLVHAVKMYRGTFILNQYGRPVEAIKTANLEWNGEEWQYQVAEFIRKASENARKATLSYLGISSDTQLYEFIDKGIDIEIKDKLGEKAYETLQMLMTEISEVREAFRIINEKVDKVMLKEAVRKVAGGVH